MSNTVKIESADQALALLQEQATEKGYSYRYTEPGSDKVCRYIEPDESTGGYQPGCIVGHILLKLGYEPTFEQPYEDDDGDFRVAFDSSIEETAASALVESGVIEAPEIVGTILTAAQSAQDNGQTWYQALSAARLVYNGYKIGQKSSS